MNPTTENYAGLRDLLARQQRAVERLNNALYSTLKDVLAPIDSLDLHPFDDQLASGEDDDTPLVLPSPPVFPGLTTPMDGGRTLRPRRRRRIR